MEAPLLSIEVDTEGIALLTLNRPAKRNALNRALLGELDAWRRAAAGDSAVRGVIVTGSGDRAFAAGADIEELLPLDAVTATEFSRAGQAIFRGFETMGKPSVAALNGFALGAGLELAISCTARIAVPEARLGLPEVRLGILPGYGGTQRLPRLVGRGRALEMMLTGEPWDAEKALSAGLIHQIVSREALLETARTWLRTVLKGGALAIAAILRTVDAGLETSLEQGLALESAAFGAVRATEDCTEGVQAFLGKRPPVWRGR